MIKLKKNVVDFVKANVKPEFVDDRIERLIENPPALTWSSRYWFDSRHTIHGKTIYFNLNKDDFEEVEELNPYVWYPRGKFDGNPKNYIIVECTQQGVVYANYKDTIFDFTHHFMYIERFKRD